MRQLNNWAVIGTSLTGKHLQGEIIGHYKWPDGTFVTTSPIQQVTPDYVITRSGTRYQLLKPSQEYVEWCNERGITINAELGLPNKTCHRINLAEAKNGMVIAVDNPDTGNRYTVIGEYGSVPNGIRVKDLTTGIETYITDNLDNIAPLELFAIKETDNEEVTAR